MLVRDIAIPERILAYSGPGAGKTHMWLSIARLWQNTGTPGTFHVIDTDFTTSTMLSKTEFSTLTNVNPVVCLEYTDIFNEVVRLKDEAKPGDWVVHDMVGNLYDMARDYFSQQTYKMDEVHKMLEHRESGDKGTHFDGFTDWPMVRSMHDKVVTDLVKLSENRGIHIFGASAERPIVTEAGSRSEKDPDILSVFGPLGARPDGHKKMPHWYHDVLYIRKTLNSRTVQIAKSRLRDGKFPKQELTDFAAQYLLGVEGPGRWEIK